VGKIDELNDAINHGVTHSHHGVDTTDRQSIEKLL
jgi:hypothetical protein